MERVCSILPTPLMMRPKKNVRRYQRMPCGVAVVIAWTDDEGSDRYARGKCIEISETGVRIELPQPIPYLSYVTLRLEGAGLAASARVRHVRRRGLCAVIGMELREPMRAQLLQALTETRNPSAA